MKTKLKFIVSLACLTGTITLVSLYPNKQAAAAVQYPTPHNAWNRIGTPAYSPNTPWSSADIDWAARTFDWFIGVAQVADYRAKTDAKMYQYTEYISYTIGSDEWIFDDAMSTYIASHGGNLEDMFLHSATPKTRANRVMVVWPSCANPDGNPFDSHDDGCQYRYFGNAASPAYRDFLADFWMVTLGNTYDGLMIDDCNPDEVWRRWGNPVAEYPGLSPQAASTQYDLDYVDCLKAVGTVFNQNNKLQLINTASYYWQDHIHNMYPAVNGVLREFAFQGGYIGDNWDRMTEFAEARNAKTAYNLNKGAYNAIMYQDLDNAIYQMDALASYYVGADPQMDIFVRESNPYNLPMRDNYWFGALSSANGNIGTPIDPPQLGGGAMMRKYTQGIAFFRIGGGNHTYSLPSGTYYELNADGSLGATPISGSYTLVDAKEGAVLINTNPTTPTITKSVDKTSASAGDTLTYTVNFSNPTSTAFTAARIEDNIPTGSTYVTGSVTGGATYDSVNKKILLNIGNLAPGANGTITFQVNVN